MAYTRKWLVFYTKSRAEKKTLQNLKKNGFEAWLPVQQQIRQWSDRKKKVEVPLFNSYIFVYEDESRIVDILKIPGITWNIRHDGKPAVLRQKEKDMIERFIETGMFIETNDAEYLNEGDRVEIMGGPLMGMIGVLREEYSENKFSVMVETIDQVLTVNIDKEMLKQIEKASESSQETYWKNL